MLDYVAFELEPGSYFLSLLSTYSQSGSYNFINHHHYLGKVAGITVEAGKAYYIGNFNITGGGKIEHSGGHPLKLMEDTIKYGHSGVSVPLQKLTLDVLDVTCEEYEKSYFTNYQKVCMSKTLKF